VAHCFPERQSRALIGVHKEIRKGNERWLNVALFVRLEAKPAKEVDIENFLRSTHDRKADILATKLPQ
jgi:hypothetical protein